MIGMFFVSNCIQTKLSIGTSVLQASQKLTSVNIARSREEKYDAVLGIKELASKGMAAEVVEEINAIDPNFFAQNPSLLFQLKQVGVVTVVFKHFQKLVK